MPTPNRNPEGDSVPMKIRKNPQRQSNAHLHLVRDTDPNKAGHALLCGHGIFLFGQSLSVWPRRFSERRREPETKETKHAGRSGEVSAESSCGDHAATRRRV